MHTYDNGGDDDDDDNNKSKKIVINVNPTSFIIGRITPTSDLIIFPDYCRNDCASADASAYLHLHDDVSYPQSSHYLPYDRT
jgi:hypothetical protein